jgi:hypothetical protein
VRALSDVNKQIEELLNNIRALASNADYTNSLDYYASSREAANRRIDGAETIYNDLEPFFKPKKAADGKPTGKKLESDFNALSHNRRDGIILCKLPKRPGTLPHRPGKLPQRFTFNYQCVEFCESKTQSQKAKPFSKPRRFNRRFQHCNVK